MSQLNIGTPVLCYHCGNDKIHQHCQSPNCTWARCPHCHHFSALHAESCAQPCPYYMKNNHPQRCKSGRHG